VGALPLVAAEEPFLEGYAMARMLCALMGGL
jgi:hypothetical protein